jgi:hypothetical protein
MSAFGSDGGTHVVVQLRRIADALEKIVEHLLGGPVDLGPMTTSPPLGDIPGVEDLDRPS